MMAAVLVTVPANDLLSGGDGTEEKGGRELTLHTSH